LCSEGVFGRRSKKNAEIAVETNAEVSRIFRAVHGQGRVDLEAVERALRAAALGGAAKLLEELLAPVGIGRREEPVVCSCKAVMRSVGVRSKRIQTLLGWVRFERSAYGCPRCGKTRYPGDEELDVVTTCRSPGLRRQTARLGAKESFQEVATDLAELADIHLCRKDAERVAEGEGRHLETWMAQERQGLRWQEPPPPETPKTIETLYIELDGTGIPMVPAALAGRKGKQSDGSAKTREAKVGCVFTQTGFDEQGNPQRDPASTSFTGAIEEAAVFAWRLYAEAVRRGLFYAKRVVVLGDGAEWVKNIAQTHFGMAQFIIDFYHASEHIGELCLALFDRAGPRTEEYRRRWTDYLWDGNVHAIVDEATAMLPKDPNAKKDARTQIGYFQKNKAHMQYADYRQEHLFIGSGVVEAACKHLIGNRLKQSGMEWTVQGANDIIALRSVVLSNRMEEYWEQRAAA
jgi:hypothetical protein